ncbi:MAG: type IV pilus modification protein PilV [Gammaproteobacteria bacterium]|nr:type IV pilus modification protein PilV [Gammaproteobacteria bacterium]MBU1489078.1 type IV pilus modification protein PilV [Gammaproteobacteria bacterium]MBU2066102.1 type IV pilus modification protein PilV [Gammaproteobacteria bacterium]MBU2139938.1 type IV pilus modification protein PilV [Gammaproteobacteria bacterium]MBU2218787.1 type IV pilus modification protein PilV [Gammaproteobacteria bacterium]
MKPARNRIKGFTLIEVMVAVVILAIGLLGMGTLMVQSLQSSESAYSRGQATVLAYDIIERMRANKVLNPDLPNQTFRVSQATLNSDYALASSTACPETVCPANCEGTAKAVSDLSQWCAALNTSLPNILPSTSITPNGANRYIVLIEWQEPNGDTGSVNVEVEL